MKQLNYTNKNGDESFTPSFIGNFVKKKLDIPVIVFGIMATLIIFFWADSLKREIRNEQPCYPFHNNFCHWAHWNIFNLLQRKKTLQAYALMSL